MNKLLLIFLFIPFLACTSISQDQAETSIIECPKVYFSSENNVYVHGKKENLDFSSIDFKASLNNFGFVGNCISDADNNKYNLDLLFIVEPISPKNKNINFPIFFLFYDLENNLVDKQYFRLNNNLNYNEETANYKITELINNIQILQDKKIQISSITIGFVNIN